MCKRPSSNNRGALEPRTDSEKMRNTVEPHKAKPELDNSS